MNTMDFDNFMSMRKLMLVGLFCLSGYVTLAQETEPEKTPVQQDSKAQERIKNLRIAYISDKLGLTPEQEFRSMIISQLQQRRLMQERKENFRDKNQLLKQRNK